jgi:hypothetical protein
MSDLWELPVTHISTTKGWRDWKDTKTSNLKKSVVMHHEALLNTYDTAEQYYNLVQTLKTYNNLPSKWNKHDEGIITGFLQHIGPYDIKVEGKLCNFLDPLEDQLHKHFLAIRKLHTHIDETPLTKDEYLRIMGIDKPTRTLSKAEMFEHCEERRRMKTKLEIYKSKKDY